VNDDPATEAANVSSGGAGALFALEVVETYLSFQPQWVRQRCNTSQISKL
jgi:hypothetical protein